MFLVTFGLGFDSVVLGNPIMTYLWLRTPPVMSQQDTLPELFLVLTKYPRVIGGNSLPERLVIE